MPTPIHCLAWFASDDGYGFSESHWILGPDDVGDLLPFTLAFDDLMSNKRRPMLAKDRVLEGIRISYTTSTGAIASSPLWYSPPKSPANQREGCSPGVAAKLRMGEATHTHFGDTYLRGFWDAVEVDERLDFTTPAGVAWKALLDDYINTLVARGYGFMGIDEVNTLRGRITGYTNDLQGFITFTVTPDFGAPLPAVGKVIPFRAARLNGSKSTLNRSCMVKVVGPTTVQTTVPTAAGAFVSAGTFVIPAKVFFPYTGSQYVKLAVRKPGRPFGRSPGRLKAKARS